MRFTTSIVRSAVAAMFLWAFVAFAQPAHAQEAERVDALAQLNGSIGSLADRVSQSVVQVLVTSYGPAENGNHGEADLVVGRQRSMASGVVVDGNGFIMTNAHVLTNARRVQVVLPGPVEHAGAIRSLVRGRGRTVEATIVGIAHEIDLALIKVSESLPAIPMADYDTLRQGELVFAFGSPEGLRNSVTMGIVSAVARQPDPDQPMVYIQTDAPINHGNSGGPLVNINGELVGINTFILSESGGSQGLGFAIPSALVQIAYPKLKRYGYLYRGQIGLSLQTVTPTLADGLGLSQDWGAMISDVVPGSPADAAGLNPGDIVQTIDGKSVDGLPRLSLELFTRGPGDHVRLGVLRGADTLRVDLVAAESPTGDQLADLVDPENGGVAAFGIIGIDVDAKSAALVEGLRIPSGVIVAAHTNGHADSTESGLTAGDTIHALNGIPIRSVAELRRVLSALTSGSAVAL